MTHRIFFLIVLSTVISQAQKMQKKEKQKKEDNPVLRLDKHYPVYVTSGSRTGKSPCAVDSLLLSLQDSLRKEGYNVVDSAQKHKLYDEVVIKDIMNSKKGLLQEERKARVNSRILIQYLRVQNFSCLEERQQYSILIYTAPKGGMSHGVNQTFSLPKDSQAHIVDVVLALIQRE